MARRLTRSKSLRSQSKNANPLKEDLISNPILVATDAEPRNDLRALDIAWTNPEALRRTAHRSPAVFERQKTANGLSDAEQRLDIQTTTSTVAAARQHPNDFQAPASWEVMHPLSPEELGIGRALGSPSQRYGWAPHPPRQLQGTGSNDSRSTATSPNSDLTHDPAPQRNDHELSRQKTGKWKMLHSIFGRKVQGSPSQDPFYQLQVSRPASTESRSTDADIKVPQRHNSAVARDGKRAAVERSRTVKEDDRREWTKPDFKRAYSAPLKRSEVNPLSLPPPPPPPPKSTKVTKPTPKLRLEAGPMLNVDIPNVQMERYSVMFGSLIASNRSSSSLLARRQATLGKLNSVNGAEEQTEEISIVKPQRRATSPSYLQSPSLSLFPSATKEERAVTPLPERPNSRPRSLTAPEVHSLNQKHEKSKTNTKHHSVSPSTSSRPQGGRTRSQQASSHHVPRPKKGQSATAKAKIPNLKEPGKEKPIKRDREEALHENIGNPKAGHAVSSPVPGPLALHPTALSRPTGKSSPPADQNKALPRSPCNASEEAEALIKSAEVSIARQISVSRRQLLLPVVPKSERLVDRKPLTPVVVELERGWSRKSQTVDIEGTL
ncbi:MAG: hypothetical protein M1819_001730 [Sarea resinae]|nr:MAG: hypothetical protein M1819_001730 [Sarea resinae]